MSNDGNERMRDIVWFKKPDKRSPSHKPDVTISKVKKGINIIFRNETHELATNTGYVRIGLVAKDKNILCFMGANEKTGWKVVPTTKSGNIYVVHIYHDSINDAIVRFEGDYNIEIGDDNIAYINRKLVL